MSRLESVLAATEYPITTAEAKTHMRITHSNDDTYIGNLIDMATSLFETWTYRALVTQTWRLNLDSFPGLDCVELPLPPLQSVSSIKYYDKDNTEFTFATSNYIVDTSGERGRIVLGYDKDWPTVSELYPVNPVQIEFIAGYVGASGVPEVDKSAVKIITAHFYENREPLQQVGGIPREIPFVLESLIMARRRW